MAESQLAHVVLRLDTTEFLRAMDDLRRATEQVGRRFNRLGRALNDIGLTDEQRFAQRHFRVMWRKAEAKLRAGDAEGARITLLVAGAVVERAWSA